MKNKKILSVVLVVALVASLAVGMTVAYLQDTDSDVNVMTMGNVYIKQNEQERVDTNELADAANNLKDFSQAKPLLPAVYPGTSIPWDANNGVNDAWKAVEANDNVVDKFVTVTNTGASAAYVRTVIAYEGDVINGQDIHVVHNDINSSNPEVGGAFAATDYIENVIIDGVRYDLIVYTYKVALQPGETTIPSLKQVYMDKTCGNEECAKYGETYDILVVSQAIQADGFADAVTALNEGFGEITDKAHPWAADFKASEVFHVSSSKEMEAAMDSTAATVIVYLEGDVSYDVTAWSNNSIGGANTQIVQIEGNGHTLTFNQLNSDWNNVIMTNEEGTLILKDLHLTNSGHNDGPWNRHDVNFACDVVMENVTTDKAVAVKGDAKLTNVTITDTGDVYGLWIQANGQTVDLENVTIATGNKASMVATAAATESGRGIKIADEYVDAPASVTLNVNNSAFFTGKKAAIVVSSDAGAKITFANSNILGCSADPINPVWVDEDWAEHASKVTVNGKQAVVEGSADIIEDVAIIGDGTSLKAALNGSEYVILSGDVNSTASKGGYSVSGANVGAGKVLDGNGNTLAVTNANATWDCAVYTSGGTIKNLTINGAFRGILTAGCSADIVIDNVIIDDVCYTISSDGSNPNYSIIVTNSTLNGWTSYTGGYKSVSFTNCSFGQGTGSYSYAYCRPYSDTTFTGCGFEEGYEFDATLCKSTFVNCFVGGTLITADYVVTLLGKDAANVDVSNG